MTIDSRQDLAKLLKDLQDNATSFAKPKVISSKAGLYTVEKSFGLGGNG
jgi:hypothetical protein